MFDVFTTGIRSSYLFLLLTQISMATIPAALLFAMSPPPSPPALKLRPWQPLPRRVDLGQQPDLPGRFLPRTSGVPSTDRFLEEPSPLPCNQLSDGSNPGGSSHPRPAPPHPMMCVLPGAERKGGREAAAVNIVGADMGLSRGSRAEDKKGNLSPTYQAGPSGNLKPGVLGTNLQTA